MNLITIYYKRRDKSLFFDLMRTIDKLNVGFSWDNERSEVKISWEWSQKKEVSDLLFFLRKVFLDARIVMENSDEGAENFEKLPENIEEIRIIEEAEVPTEMLDDSMEISSMEAEVVSDIDEKVELVIQEELEYDESFKAETKKEEKIDEDDFSATAESSKLDVSDNLEETDQEQEKEEEENADVTGAKVLDSFAEVEPIHETENDEAIELITTAKPEATNSKDGLDKLLDDTFAEIVKKLVEDEDSLKPNKLKKIFAELNITSEALSWAVILAPSNLTNIDRLYELIARKMKKNVALIKVDVRKSFEKWMQKEHDDIWEKYPDIEVKDFLNTFRKENEKF